MSDREFGGKQNHISIVIQSKKARYRGIILVRFANEALKKALDDLSLPKGRFPSKFTLKA